MSIVKMESCMKLHEFTIEYGVHYQLLTVITEVAQWGTPSCSRPLLAMDNGIRDGRSIWLVAPPPSWAVVPPQLCVHSINWCSSATTLQPSACVCDTQPLCVSHTLQSALESGQKARIVQIDFSAAFDRVNHQGIWYKLCSVGIGGSVLSILTQFLSNRSQHVMVDGCM